MNKELEKEKEKEKEKAKECFRRIKPSRSRQRATNRRRRRIYRIWLC